MSASLHNPTQWLNRARWAMGGLMAFSALMFYLTWYRPVKAVMNHLQSHIEDARLELDSAQTREKELPALKADVYRLQAKLEPFTRKLPKQAELGSFLKEIGNVCQRGANEYDGTRFALEIRFPVKAVAQLTHHDTEVEGA